jgi:N-acetylneuraminic acid mutarotase
VSGAKIALRWNHAPSGSAEVAHWRVLRDRDVLIEEVPVPQATVPNEGFHSYTVVAVGKDGQDSAESQGWHSPPAWQKLKTGFQRFSLAGVAAHNGELWVVGGMDANGKRDEVLVFNPQTKKWKKGPKLPKPISHAPLVSTGDKLYLLGGLTATKDDDGVPLATVYSFDTKNPGGAWIKEDDLPAPRYGGAAAWDGKRLVFAGGAESYEPNTPRPAAAEIWELRRGKWESIDDVLQPARGRTAAATDGKGRIWFVGGADDAPRKVYADVEVLHGNKVSDSTPIRTAVQGAAAVWTHDTGTCIFGGSTIVPNQTAIPVAKVQCLEGTDPGWPDLLEARHNAGAAVIDNTVYVVGSRSCSPCLAGGGSEPAETVLALRFG